jgi:AcrR family transcriptional regulator
LVNQVLEAMPAEKANLIDVDEGGESRLRRDKRNLILDAAIRVFARMGYHGARVSDIAREAGIAYGLVYHYFKNKEEILSTIFNERWGMFIDAVEGIDATPNTARQKLVSIAALVLHAHRLRPDWVKVLVLEIQRTSRFSQLTQMRSVGRLFQVMAKILEQGQNDGELRSDVDPEVASFLFIGGLELVITARVLDVLQVDPEDEQEYYQKVAKTVVDIFINGLGAGETSR